MVNLVSWAVCCVFTLQPSIILLAAGCLPVAWRLVDKLIPPSKLTDETRKIAEEVAARSRRPKDAKGIALPAVERDTVLQVLRALLVGPVSWSRGLLAVAVSASIVLSLTVLWFLIVELTRFYFHANHVVHDDGEVYTPRFTLTGIRLPEGELDAASDAEYAEVHRAERTVRLLVPGNARARATIEWPMLSSSISGIAAIGATLRTVSP